MWWIDYSKTICVGKLSFEFWHHFDDIGIEVSIVFWLKAIRIKFLTLSVYIAWD